ncbi:MAG: flagellar hook-associated protein FlgK, partial [Pseudomonadota bacterium]
MSITNALNNALSGLRANGRLADVTAGNLANALTPGYGRQSVDLSSQITGTQGTGVKVDGISRALDPELSAARRLADGDLAERNAAFEGLTRLERSIGTVGDPGSLFQRLTEFEQALRQLGETPENAARQDAAANAAKDLADTFNRIGQDTVQLRAETDIEIGRTVDNLNTTLEEVARLNRQIQIAQAGGRNTAPLIDKREAEIDKVAQVIPIRQTVRQDGVIELMTREGIGLVDIRAQKVEYAVTPVYEAGLSYGAGGTLSGLTLR